MPWVSSHVAAWADRPSWLVGGLHSLFRRAGLPMPRLALAAPMGGVTDELADIDTLLPRWQEEAAAAGAVVMMPPMITAWSHLP
jgi:hypothetical protein